MEDWNIVCGSTVDNNTVGKMHNLEEKIDRLDKKLDKIINMVATLCEDQDIDRDTYRHNKLEYISYLKDLRTPIGGVMSAGGAACTAPTKNNTKKWNSGFLLQ